MSSKTYRQHQQDLEEARRMELEKARMLLREAEDLSPRRANIVAELRADFFNWLGGKALQLETEACETIIRAGNLSREFDAENLRYNLARIRKHEEPETEGLKAPVSAATHLGAIRKHRELEVVRCEIMEEVEIESAKELQRHDGSERAKQQRENRKDAVPNTGESAAKAAPLAPVEQRATPVQSATSHVA